MTLDEKLGQLTQTPAGFDQTGPAVDAGGQQQVREGKLGSFLGLYGAEATRRMQRIAVEESRLHIPLLFGYDVIHGMRTIFPVPLAMGATFDSAAAVRMARVSAVEATAMGIHWTFAPMVDIARDARWGRVVEGAGEDPYLGSVMAAAQVRGYQGDDLSSPTAVLATAKHFAAYGGAEAGRDYNVVSISERDLWSVYLPPFRTAVRAGVGSFMASFNEINGTPSHANDWLLTTVLRKQWGFRGIVVSDYTGVWELIQHGLGDSVTVAARALRAGVDMEMSSVLYREKLGAEVRAGRFPVAVVDTAVRRILRMKAVLGLFDDPYRGSSVERERRDVLTPEHRAAAREIASEAVVLLTNKTVGGRAALPLGSDLRSVAVIGALAVDSTSVLGAWHGAGDKRDAVTVLDGLRRALPDASIRYAAGVALDTARIEGPVNSPGIAEAEQLARTSDAVILVLGETEAMSGEATSRTSVELPGAQLQLAQAVVRAAHASNPSKLVIAVLMNGRPLAVPWLADSASALVESWHLGVEHGNALADILLGRSVPSAKLPITFPRVTGQLPMYYNHKNTGRPASSEKEKYTSKYIDAPFTPLFPFGHGLSYTTFGYQNLRVSRSTLRGSDSLTVTVDVSNTGARAGVEVAQLYLRDDAASVTRPVRELRGFRRVMLQPGETRRLSFGLGPDDLALYDRAMRRVVEPGGFTVWAGGSSAATLEAHFTVIGGITVLSPAPPKFW